jgi:hypothetical protein
MSKLLKRIEKLEKFFKRRNERSGNSIPVSKQPLPSNLHAVFIPVLPEIQDCGINKMT